MLEISESEKEWNSIKKEYVEVMKKHSIQDMTYYVKDLKRDIAAKNKEIIERIQEIQEKQFVEVDKLINIMNRYNKK